MRVQTLAYILWRAIATGYLSLRETSDLYGVFAREIARVSREIDHILRSIDRPQHRKRCAFLEKDGDYSRAGVIDPNRIQHLSQSLQIHPARALRKLLRNTQLNPGIHVSLVNPGAVKSRFRDNSLANFDAWVDTAASPHRETYVRLRAETGAQKDRQPFIVEPEAVARKIAHALESRRPRARYYVTLPAYALATARCLLPSSWLDSLLSRI